MQIILTIAGSDPSGGAGIQADIKTITSTGYYAAAAITAITCQNSLGVSRIAPLESLLVRDQIISVLEDLDVSHVKIGMIGNNSIIAAIRDGLSGFSGEIILDPVLKASTGTSLLTDAPNSLSPLISLATVLTPNTNELSLLSGLNCSNKERSILAGQDILKTFPNLKAICLKGGHLKAEDDIITDIILCKTGSTISENSVTHQRLQTRNSHGTGCTFASAFSSFHAQHHDYVKAFTKAVTYVHRLLEQGQGDSLGAGTGPLVHYRQNR